MAGEAHGIAPEVLQSWISRGVDYTQGVGHHVVIRAREDLFVQTSDKLVCDDGRELPAIQLFSENSVTSIPDNMGCCEVVSVGSLVTNVKPGEIYFIDFSDVAQGFQLANKDHYVALDKMFRCRFDPVSGEATPCAGYVLTKRAPERMKVALTGTDRIEVPQHLLTEGIPSGCDSDGEVLLRTIYEEVVSVGPPEAESHSRPLHRVERALLDAVMFEFRGHSVATGKSHEAEELDVLHMPLALAINAYLRWRRAPRALDLQPGDLVPFCTIMGTKLRVRGQFLTLVPQSECLCVIDDRAILEEAIRAGKAGRIVLARVGT
jgi:hypothetical protein